jgi:enoyl-CoA hydratase/carnithine racemase
MLQLADRLGPARAAELVFLSEPVSAEQMCAWNVVNRVVDDGSLEEAARDLATGPTRAFATTKALWRLQAEAGARAALRPLYAALRDAVRQGRAEGGRGGGRGNATPLTASPGLGPV